MKKTLLSVLSVITFITIANGQPFKQVGGENNLQLQFTPWGNSPISLHEGTILFRKFNATGDAAWRIGFTIGSAKNTSVIVQGSDSLSGNFPDSIEVPFGFPDYILVAGLNPQADRSDKTFSFSIRPGYEKHFAGTERLSPYIGAEIIFTMSNTKSEVDSITLGNYSIAYDDTSSLKYVPAAYTTQTLTQKSGSTTFGINLIAGFDYYIAKNLSLGAELNFGYYHTGYKDLESEYVKNTTSFTSVTDINNVTHNTVSSTNAVTSAPKQKQGSSSGFGPGVVTAIKLGWLF
ncbi:MAG: hypothetical protein ABI723_11600 [Bacteroidia bacterium]